jgi:predicted Holliday junction resolvase-like endonuclease
MMKNDLVHYFTLQRSIFGICPCCGELFRLSDARVFVRTRPVKDWLDRLDAESVRLDLADERLKDQKEALSEKARVKARLQAREAIRKVDRVFAPRRLNPDDAKTILHPVDFVVFNGMKDGPSIRNLVLLDHESKSKERRLLQKSIERVVEKGWYEWRTLRVHESGVVKEE